MTTIQKAGERFYLNGLPFNQKDAAKAAGCRWDSGVRKWWTPKLEVAEELSGTKLDQETSKEVPVGKTLDLSYVTSWGAANELIVSALPSHIEAERRWSERVTRAEQVLRYASKLVSALRDAGADSTALEIAKEHEEAARLKLLSAEEKLLSARKEARNGL